eukprot:INCI9587.2.p1 GENE.INCI9587.2~~INCI9587.2.p1  ORF type:complete len:331 (+),score=46.11 INCI9587.2:81-1073(+)
MSSEGSVFVIGVVGPSGSGKTTVCHELAKLLNATCVIGEDDYRKKDISPGQSYSDRDPRVETPASVDWTRLLADVASAKQRLLRKSAAANGKTEYLLIEHFLLLASPGDQLLHDVDSILVLRVDDATVPCERRVSRKQDRSANECAALREYYYSHVWPAYEKYTLKRLQRLKTVEMQSRVGLIEVDASQQTSMLVLSDLFQRLWLSNSGKTRVAPSLCKERGNAVERVLQSNRTVRVGFKLFYCEAAVNLLSGPVMVLFPEMLLSGVIGPRDFDSGHMALLQFFGSMVLTFGGVLLLGMLRSRNEHSTKMILKARFYQCLTLSNLDLDHF